MEVGGDVRYWDVLVGGTALSLQIGHQISIEIDLFSRQPFDGNKLFIYLEGIYGFS